MEGFRCGTIALIGRPNAGKSTLLNQVLGQKVSIISAKPQTTRNRIVGIHTTESGQAILIDTPGIHAARSRMNRAMVQTALDSLIDVDLVCWVVDAERMADRKGNPTKFDPALEHIAKAIEQGHEGPVLVVLNKVDRLAKPALLPLMASISQRLPGTETIPLSALRGKGIDILTDAWAAHLPEGPQMFPEDQIMDGSERFLVTELVREKIFQMTSQEIPYSTAVEIEVFEEEDRDGEKPFIEIYARIFVERSSQKGIVIGKGGSMLKRIGTAARKDIQRLLGARVHLQLHVTVQDSWTGNPRLLHELGLE